MALVYFLETGWQLLGRSKLHLEPFRNKGSKETLLAGCSESKYMTIKGHSQIITYVFLNISKLTKEPTKSKTIQKNVLPGACSINRQSNVLLPPVHPILTYNQCTTAPLTQLAIVAPSQMLNALLKYSHRTASYLVMRDSCILLYINTSINICVYTYIIYIYILYVILFKCQKSICIPTSV